VYNNIGLAHTNQGHYSEALENFHKALSVRQALSSTDATTVSTTTTMCNNIALVCSAQDRLDEALEHFTKALQV
jgi:tetratricopeptide (TPR) repeat protein